MAKEHKVTCKNFLEEMSDYFDGAEDLRVEVEAHMAKCPNCWVVFNETERTVRIVKDVDCHPMPPGVETRLLQAIGQRWERE